MSQNLTCTRIGKYRPEKFAGSIGDLFGMKVLTSSILPHNRMVIIDECSDALAYFKESLKGRPLELKDWVWNDFTKLRPETIQKIRKCRKIALAKAKCRLS